MSTTSESSTLEPAQNLPVKVEPSSYPFSTKRALEWLVETSGFALIPAAGYYLVFVYESAYCSVFGVPASLVEPNITTILVCSVLVLAFGTLIASVFESFLWLSEVQKETRPALRIVKLYSAPIVLLIVCLAVSSTAQGILLAKILGALSLIDVLIAIIFANKKRTFAFRLEGPLRLYGEPDSPSHLTRRFGRYGILVVLVYVASFLTGIFGRSQALKQTVFHSPTSYPDSIVVRFYGERAICAGVDSKTKKLTHRFFVTPTDRATTGEFILRENWHPVLEE